MKLLENKRVLLICPNFYNYHTEIKHTLQNLGAQVDFYEDMGNSYKDKALAKNPQLLKAYKEKHLRLILQEASQHSYDFLFVVRGKLIEPFFITEIKQQHPNITCLMYQWDAIKFNDYTAYLKLFDQVFTFDREDFESLQGQIQYLPLFFIKNYEQAAATNITQDIDILFVGGWHSDRFELLKACQKFAKKEGLSYYFWLYLPFLYYLKRVVKGKLQYANFVKWSSLTHQQSQALFARANCIFDIEIPNQSGLTMRTLEALGSGKKLITTNTYITQESFYKPEVIHLIDREKPIFAKDFIKNSYEPLDMQDYSLESWVKHIFQHT